ncbi:CAP family protein [Kitasatospora sp. NPDC059795]|uniref:CAP family protein n=1 Tax=Kitasatospora sp. NPDC059795 TaxID=3346949 RepID=UPI00364AD7E1
MRVVGSASEGVDVGTWSGIRRAGLVGVVAAVVVVGAVGPVGAVGVERRGYTDSSDGAFQDDCLAAINGHRARHQVAPLVVDPKIVEYAKSRAQQVSRPDGFNHDGLARGYGETLSWSSTGVARVYSPESCGDAVDFWYEGSAQYDYGRPGFSRETGNFTQLVWKATTKVGCARVGGPREGGPDSEGYSWSDTYIVCDFAPRGNVAMDPQDPAKAYRENVLPPVAG